MNGELCVCVCVHAEVMFCNGEFFVEWEEKKLKLKNKIEEKYDGSGFNCNLLCCMSYFIVNTDEQENSWKSINKGPNFEAFPWSTFESIANKLYKTNISTWLNPGNWLRIMVGSGKFNACDSFSLRKPNVGVSQSYDSPVSW